jgi:hypothetical protein
MNRPFSNQTEVAIIGAGGIGSFFCRHLDRMITHNQLPFSRDRVTVFDFDAVEGKNLRHQDYEEDDLGVPKSLVMAERYGFKYCCLAFVAEHCQEFGLYIICADNPLVRKEVYEHATQYRKPFLDMRSEGKQVAVFTHEASRSFLMNSLGAKPESNEGQSCQLAVDTAADRIQMGNAVVAPKGTQILMEMQRKALGEEVSIPPFVMENLNTNLTVMSA